MLFETSFQPLLKLQLQFFQLLAWVQNNNNNNNNNNIYVRHCSLPPSDSRWTNTRNEDPRYVDVDGEDGSVLGCQRGGKGEERPGSNPPAVGLGNIFSRVIFSHGKIPRWTTGESRKIRNFSTYIHEREN